MMLRTVVGLAACLFVGPAEAGRYGVIGPADAGRDAVNGPAEAGPYVMNGAVDVERHAESTATARSTDEAVGAQETHQHEDARPEKLGKVRFDTSCKSDVRRPFDRAVALLHSFWFPAAIEAFQQVSEKDPACGMAYWGLALSHWGNPFGGSRSPRALEQGSAAIAKAVEVGAKTERERAYIAAAALLFKDYASVDQRTRTLAYEQAMEELSKTHRRDSEASALYGLALASNALPTDKTYGNQLKAAEILEKLFEEQPDHPGLAHYIIHAYDAPPLADRALDAARRYAKIAPSVPHALHMPSHTFTRVGSWQESIETNIASADAATKANSPGEALHAYDYEVYAYLQTSQDRAASAIVDALPAFAAKLDAGAGYGPAGLYAMAAIPARYALERGAWAEAAALEARATAVPYADAITHFARAIGAARSGRPAAARPDVAKLAALRDTLANMKETYWSEQAEIQRLVASAWITFAEGRREEALLVMRSAADLEDTTDKSAISPGPIAPARELLGDMLLGAGQPADALVEYEASMRKEPKRFRNTYGAAKAAAAAGDKAKARTYYAKLVEICKKADTPRAELAEARKTRS